MQLVELQYVNIYCIGNNILSHIGALVWGYVFVLLFLLLIQFLSPIKFCEVFLILAPK